MSLKEIFFPKDTCFLVTGGAGFIGSNICEHLIGVGCKVRCLDNFSTGRRENISDLLNNPNFELMEGDIRDFETCLKACNGMEYVLNQAAWGSVPRSIEFPQLYEDINIRGTLNMLEAARQSGVKKFVYASSSSVYGDEPNLPKIEERIGRALSPYALTKKVNEEYGILYKELYGLDTIGLRYFNVFGRRQDFNSNYAAVIPQFIKKMLSNERPIINGDGMHSRDFTYIDNVIEANLKACLSSKEAAGKVFNISYGGRVSIKDLYFEIARLLGFNETPIYGPDRLGDIKHSNADISKAKKMLGYNPEYSFPEGIKKCVEWYARKIGAHSNE
jgi:UDP-N-acetylglucosamine 4-epimerase